jgi:UDP-glucose 4-epimerase/dTDP-L-rhamnose 4-epimerase
VDDIADATLLAVLRPQAHRATINVGTGHATSIAQIAELVRQHHPGAEVAETTMPRGDPLGGCADTVRMRTVLGWAPPITIENGIRRYLQWLDQTPAAIPAWLRDMRADKEA